MKTEILSFLSFLFFFICWQLRNFRTGNCSLTYNQRINLCVDCLIISRYQERVKIHFEKLILGDEDVRYSSLINPRLPISCVRPFSIFEFLCYSVIRLVKGRP